MCGLVRACCTSAWLISDRESSHVAGYSDERRLVELKTSGAIPRITLYFPFMLSGVRKKSP